MQKWEYILVAIYEGRVVHVNDIPLPDFWGGYRVVPDHIEFWQGRESRLHDRFDYRLHADGSWRLERLAP